MFENNFGIGILMLGRGDKNSDKTLFEPVLANGHRQHNRQQEPCMANYKFDIYL